MQHSCSHYNAFRNIPWQTRTYLRTWQHQMTTMSSHSNAICNQRFKNRIELRTQTQPLVAKHIGGTIRAQNDRSRTRRTHEVPFIAGCRHFTRKNTRFRAPASSPKQSPCNIHAAIPMRSATTTSRKATLHGKTQGFVLRLPPQLTTSLPHPLPIVTTSHRHHLPSSTSLRHHFPSSPLPIVPTSLPHHSPSSSLPFVTTSHRHHFLSSPLPFVTTSHRHHFPSSPLPFVTTSLRHHPSLSPPFIKVNSTASYSFVMYCYVMYCYVIYHPASCQVAEFYLSVTRKYASQLPLITHAAAAPSNLDAATTMRSAETELQNTIELHAMASEIAAPKPDLDAKATKRRF